jgi:feruloyl esterase
MAAILDASSPDLRRFASNPKRKLLIFHGWSDPIIQPEPTVDYYQTMAKQTFAGDFDKTRAQVRLFMFPGMAHCSGGPGPSVPEDLLRRLEEWVEGDKAPDYAIARHRTKGVVDNERKVCAFPQRAVYIGPEGQHNDPRNWIAENFSCR